MGPGHELMLVGLLDAMVLREPEDGSESSEEEDQRRGGRVSMASGDE